MLSMMLYLSGSSWRSVLCVVFVFNMNLDYSVRSMAGRLLLDQAVKTNDMEGDRIERIVDMYLRL
jgi:hypothetical protein